MTHRETSSRGQTAVPLLPRRGCNRGQAPRHPAGWGDIQGAALGAAAWEAPLRSFGNPPRSCNSNYDIYVISLSKDQSSWKRSGSVCRDRSSSPDAGLRKVGVLAGAGLRWGPRHPRTGNSGRARLAGAQRCPESSELFFGFRARWFYAPVCLI